MNRRDNTPENIRVCVTSPPSYHQFLTWYWSGDIYWTDRRTGETGWCGSAFTLEEFNMKLYDWEILPIGFGRGGEEKAKDNAGLMKLPF